jgi:hypothetical protein
MDMSSNDTVIQLKGEQKEVPSTWLTLEQVALLRDYSNMCAAMGYQAEMICGACGEPIECYVQEDIGIFCSCRARVWKRS